MTTNTELAAAKRFLEKLGGGAPTTVLCAVSGGLDSMCLLHLLSTWGREQNLAVTAAHFNHQLRGAESHRDEAFVRSWCEERGISFVSGSGDVRAHAEETGKTLEEAARELRYAFLAEQKQLRDCVFILTAHHADDNAETMLLNLLRGTGARGLSGIPERRGEIARPFLWITREELAAYAAAHHIKYVEDSTNALDEAARNVLRHRVLPVLRELNPRAVENMARTAEQLKDDDAVLDRMAEGLLRQCRPIENGLCVDAEPCLQAERAVLTRAVHGMLMKAAGRRKDLTARHVEGVCALLYGPAGKTLSLPYGLTARREEGALMIAGAAPAPEAMPLPIGETVTFGRWCVSVTEQGPGWEVQIPADAVLSVSRWDRNDRMTLPGGRGERSFKRLCSDRGISPAERDTMPVLRVNGRCAAAPGIGSHCEFLSGQDRAVFVNFQFRGEKET